MDETRSGSGTYGGIALILLIAIGALAFFKFDLLGVQTWMRGDEKPIEVPGADSGDTGLPGPRTLKGPAFPPEPPSDEGFRIERPRPLPERIVVTQRAGALTVEVPMRLVPQGWFPMGENDGVRADGPKRWVWMDDYYLAETECTNEQYYAFILDRGYESAKYWTPEGFNFIRRENTRGTRYLGWRRIDRTSRIWSLASPHVELTLEFLDAGGVSVPQGSNVLVLPRNDEMDKWIQYNSESGSVWVEIRGGFREVNGEEIAVDPRVTGGRYLHKTDAQGRVSIADPGKQFDLAVIAWVDGEYRKPLIGYASRTAEHQLRHATMPVLGMSWFEADACSRFFGGSLPTEAQWEKAARGPEGRPYPWGDDAGWNITVDVNGVKTPTTPHANINRGMVTAVGYFPSGRGPYQHVDLAGNVSEWCADVYLESPPIKEANPFVRGTGGERRVERGTNTRDDDCMPSSRRRYSDPYARMDHRGFRMAMTVEQALEAANR